MTSRTDEQIRFVLDVVRSGHGPTTGFARGTNCENQLRIYASEGKIDQEEAHLALIEGNRSEAKVILDAIKEGYLEGHQIRINDLLQRGYLDQENIHLAMIEGTKIY